MNKFTHNANKINKITHYCLYVFPSFNIPVYHKIGTHIYLLANIIHESAIKTQFSQISQIFVKYFFSKVI